MKSTVAIHRILPYFVDFSWLKNVILHSCVNTLLVHKFDELILTCFDLWQIHGKPTVPFVVKLGRGLNLNSDFLLRPIINLDQILENQLKKWMFLLKSALLKSIDETPPERLVVTVSGCVDMWMSMCICVHVHACEHTLLVCDGSRGFTAKAVHFIFSNFSDGETFLYANRKLNVKK